MARTAHAEHALAATLRRPTGSRGLPSVPAAAGAVRQPIIRGFCSPTARHADLRLQVRVLRTPAGRAAEDLRPGAEHLPGLRRIHFLKQVTAAGFQLKGSGWYATDFRGGNTSAAGATDCQAGRQAGRQRGAGRGAARGRPAAAPAAADKPRPPTPEVPREEIPARRACWSGAAGHHRLGADVAAGRHGRRLRLAAGRPQALLPARPTPASSSCATCPAWACWSWPLACC